MPTVIATGAVWVSANVVQLTFDTAIAATTAPNSSETFDDLAGSFVNAASGDPLTIGSYVPNIGDTFIQVSSSGPDIQVGNTLTYDGSDVSNFWGGSLTLRSFALVVTSGGGASSANNGVAEMLLLGLI